MIYLGGVLLGRFVLGEFSLEAFCLVYVVAQFYTWFNFVFLCFICVIIY